MIGVNFGSNKLTYQSRTDYVRLFCYFEIRYFTQCSHSFYHLALILSLDMSQKLKMSKMTKFVQININEETVHF